MGGLGEEEIVSGALEQEDKTMDYETGVVGPFLALKMLDRSVVPVSDIVGYQAVGLVAEGVPRPSDAAFAE